MLVVLFVAGTPIVVTCLEAIFWTNYLAFEEGSKSSMFAGQACGHPSVEFLG